jgi:hypothetical protein
MKRIFTLASAVTMIAVISLAQHSAVARGNNKATGVPASTPAESVKWVKTTHDFGTVQMGPAAVVTFKFTNTGTTPIVIKTANPSCGCTTPTFTSTPVMPGETGEVKASYATEGRPGYFQKTVTVTFDNGTVTMLTIQGTVATDTPAKTGDELK